MEQEEVEIVQKAGILIIFIPFPLASSPNIFSIDHKRRRKDNDFLPSSKFSPCKWWYYK